MGNFTCKPTEGGEGLKGFLTRKFGRAGSKKKIDQLVEMALTEDCDNLRRQAETVTAAELDEYYEQLDTVVDEYDTKVVELELVGVGIRLRPPPDKGPLGRRVAEKLLPHLKKQSREKKPMVNVINLPKDKNAVIARAPKTATAHASQKDAHGIHNEKEHKCIKDSGLPDVKGSIQNDDGTKTQKNHESPMTTLKENTEKVKARVIEVKSCDSPDGQCLKIKAVDNGRDKGRVVMVTESKTDMTEPTARKTPVFKFQASDKPNKFLYKREHKTRSADEFSTLRNIQLKKP